ncbi:MAG: hypothetical protein R3B91_19860 [Planctomycetaceae bacterium]
MNGQKFDGIDYFLFHPHTDPDASDDELKAIADKIAAHGFAVGLTRCPDLPGTVGDSRPWVTNSLLQVHHRD